MNNNTNLRTITNSALKARRELNRLEAKDADVAAVKSAHVTWTAYADDYAAATGQSLSDAKDILSALA